MILFSVMTSSAGIPMPILRSVGYHEQHTSLVGAAPRGAMGKGARRAHAGLQGVFPPPAGELRDPARVLLVDALTLHRRVTAAWLHRLQIMAVRLCNKIQPQGVRSYPPWGWIMRETDRGT